jgi:hypothetical protein
VPSPWYYKQIVTFGSRVLYLSFKDRGSRDTLALNTHFYHCRIHYQQPNQTKVKAKTFNKRPRKNSIILYLYVFLSKIFSLVNNCFKLNIPLSLLFCMCLLGAVKTIIYSLKMKYESIKENN